MLLDLFAEFFEKQDLLSKLTENDQLHGYGISDIHAIVAIKTIDHANVTKIANHMHMTRGAISKMMKRLIKNNCVMTYHEETNKKEIYFELTDLGNELYKDHEKRHSLWLQRDQEFLDQHNSKELKIIENFMYDFNKYLEERIEELGGKENAY